MLQKLLLKDFVKKKAEATGDLIGNKIADETTSVNQSKSKEKEKKDRYSVKIEYRKIKNLLDT